MDKEKIILALLTPRSGELNYRYLIPEGVSYSDMKLGEIRNQLERSDKDRPGTLFQCEARQLGGRMGTESLIFQVPEFQRYPQEEQNRCRELLQDWFDNKREAVIQSIDWSLQGNASMIAIPELTQLRNQISEILSTPEKIDRSSGSTATVVPIKNRYSLVQKIIMFAITLCILLISAINIPVGDISEKIHRFWSGESKEQDQAPSEQLAQYEKLFRFPVGTPKPLKKIDYKEAFNDLYRYCDLTTMDLDQYLQESYFQDIVQQQRLSQYPVFGTVPEEDRVKLLDNVKGISPVQLRRILAVYKKMQDASNKSEYSDFKSKLYEFRIDFPPDPAGVIDNSKGTAQPMFFVQAGSAKELEWAMTIHDFIFSIIEDEFGDEINSGLSQKSLLSLIQTKLFNNSFNSDKCNNNELRIAYKEFYSVLKEIAKEAKN